MKEICIQDEIAAKLTAMAVQKNETLDMTADHALREYFSYKEEEDRRWQEALAADAAMEQGKIIEGENVVAWLKSWGGDDELPSP